MIKIKKTLLLIFWAAEIVVGLFLLGVSPPVIAGIFLLLSGVWSFFFDCYKDAVKELILSPRQKEATKNE